MREEPPFIRLGAARPARPVLLSVPHGGRGYSAGLLALARLPRERLEALEDRLVDRLAWRAVAAGATAYVACAPRAEIDLNRDEREIDPALVDPPLPSGAVLQSARTRGGIGLVPTRIGGAGPIWRRPLSRAELERRIARIHRPYHAALAEALDDLRGRFGAAALLDCHSMPPRGGGDAEVVIGDRHGTSAGGGLAAAALDAVRAAGFRAGFNAPYAGGHVVARHGRPEEGLHALQIEIDRSLYLDAALKGPGAGFERCARLIESVAAALEAALPGALPLAAE